MAAATTPRKAKDFVSDQDVRWCPGCGDYSILKNVQRVMPDIGVPKEDIVFVSGIGCSSRFPLYMDTFGFHTIHGRAPAFATGMKAARPELSVWVVTGDGDGLSIGGNHLMHVLRRNLDVQILLFNNRVYGLTKGQYSPTSRVGMISKSTPQGSIDHPIDPVSFALGAGASFVARAIDVDGPHLQEMLKRAAAHRGTALIEILQNCPVYNDNEWGEVQDRKTRPKAALVLEHGEPLVWGGPGERCGIAITDGVPSVVALDDDDDPVAKGVAVHDESHQAPSFAFALASLARPEFPLPIGVIRAVEKPSYERMLADQVDAAKARAGVPDLEALLHSGDTWTVES